MGHEDAGHYSLKHKDATINPEIAEALKNSAQDSTITCSAVHKVSKNFGVTPAEAGIQVDLLEMRIKKCMLGLFGYEPDGKNFDSGIEISEDFASEIKGIAPNGRTTCIQCWELASKLEKGRMEIGSACEKLGIRIKQCQIGAF